jgi:hypothetical protein
MKTRREVVAVLLLMMLVSMTGVHTAMTAQHPPDTTTSPPPEPEAPKTDTAAAGRDAMRQASARAAAEKAGKAAAEKLAAERIAAETDAADKAAIEKTAADKKAAEVKAAEQKAADAKALAEKIAFDKAAAAKAAMEAAAAERRWRMLLLITSAALSFIAVILLSFLLFRLRRSNAEQAELARCLDGVASKLDTALQFLDGKLQKISAGIAEKVAEANFLTPAHLSPIAADLGKLHEDVARIGQDVAEIASRPAASSRTSDQVTVERQILGEWWKSFRANPDLSAAFDNASRETTWMPLLKELTKVVPADLKPTFDAVVAPCEEHRILIQKISLVPRVVSGEVERLTNEAEELRRTREFADLLQSAQSAGDASGRLSFRVKSWITDTFLPFADLYLQRYQQARLDNRHDELQPGLTLVRQLLQIAAVEPIDVTPGETAFDSTRHIGRSTTNDHRFADGVITGVVRNGFVEGGQQVIRQPEVIVNRTR